MNLNVLLRGQSNAVILGQLTGEAGLKAQIEKLLGFDGLTNTVTLRFQTDSGTNNNTAVGGTALVGDWLTRTATGGWQAGTYEQGLLNYINGLSANAKAEPTIVLWLHNEYDSDGAHAGLTSATWESAVRYDASLVRAAYGSNVPYVFVEPIPYPSGTDAGAQAIRIGMEELVTDSGFNARLTSATDDLQMDADVFGAGGHMNQSDAALVASRAARTIAEAFGAYAQPGSAVAAGNGNIDDTGPIAIQAQLTGTRQVTVTLKFDAATSINPLDADAATGIGWTAMAGSTELKATGVALGANNTLIITFGADLPTGATLHYGYGNAQLVGAGNTVSGNGIYDEQGLLLRTPAKGLVIGGAAVVPGATQSGTPGDDGLVAGPGGDTLIGGKGSDFLTGGTGADTFVFSRGDGNDWITGFTPGVDKIKFNLGVTAGDVIVTPLSFDAGGTIVSGIGIVYSADGSDGIFLAGITEQQWQAGDIIYTPPPAAPSSVQRGTAGDDGLIAEANGDTLIGGKGNDYLVGGAGRDVFGFELGDGMDFVEGFTTGADKLLFGSSLTIGDINTFQGDIEGIAGLFVQYGPGDDFLFIAGLATLAAGDITFGALPAPVAPSYTVVRAGVTTQEKAAAYAGTIPGLEWQYTGTAGAESVTGSSGVDAMIMGAGDDTVSGGIGNDRLDGGAGRDIAVFSGGKAQTTLVRNADGSWTATGPDGTDTLVGIEVARFSDGDRLLQNTAAHDFSGTGSSDILWRGMAGEVAVWQMNGMQVVSSGLVANPGSAWSVAGTGDFDGDGRADILWRGIGGEVAVWQMNGTQIAGGGAAPNPGNHWSIAGTGDFDGDGRADILWRGQAGEVAVWQMNGTQVAGGGAAPNPGNHWGIAGTGDFDGDGRADILWRGQAGEVAVWQMNGTQVVGGGLVANPGDYWSIAGTGDFDGDGRADILWRGVAGEVVVWQMNGTQIVGGGTAPNPGDHWQVSI